MFRFGLDSGISSTYSSEFNLRVERSRSMWGLLPFPALTHPGVERLELLLRYVHRPQRAVDVE